MNILEIAFSIDWFLTIPGMLITAGVFLLIVALIMMLVGSKKNKKKEMKENNQNVASAPTALPVQPEVVNTPQNVEAPVNTVATSEPLGPIPEMNDINIEIPVVNPVEMPTINSVADTSVVPTVEPVIEPMMPIPTIEPVVEIPTSVNPVEVIVPMEPVATINSVEEIIPTEEIKPVEEEVVLEQPDATNLDKTSVNIYGGNPIPTIEPIVDTPRPIYGGADPLEATQNLPKVDVHHEPYSGGRGVVIPIPEIQSIPVVEEIPVAPPVISIPEVNNVVPEVAEVVPITNDVVIEPIEEVVQPVKEETSTPVSEVVQIPDIEQL